MNSSLTLSKHLVKFLIPVKFKLQGGDSGGRGSVSSQSSVGLRLEVIALCALLTWVEQVTCLTYVGGTSNRGGYSFQ